MGLEVCSKCHKFHWVPGPCPVPRAAVSVASSPPAPKTSEVMLGKVRGALPDSRLQHSPARDEATKAAQAATPRVDDLGSVQDALKMSTDGRRSGRVATASAPPLTQVAPPAKPDLTTRGTPRQRAPKGTFDRKQWQRDYQARQRDKAKKGQP